MTAFRSDGALENAISSIGQSNLNLYNTPFLSKAQQESLYKMWICRNICEAYPQEATRKWVEIGIAKNTDNELLSKFNKYTEFESDEDLSEDIYSVRSAFETAQTWANIYGGAAIIIFADDGLPFDQPLNLKRLKSIRGLDVLDRYKIIPVIGASSSTIRPTHYQILVDSSQVQNTSLYFQGKEKNKQIFYNVHASRLIRFDGIKYTPDMMQQNSGWGGSLLESIYKDLAKQERAFDAINDMVYDFSLFVWKLKGLSTMIASGKEDALSRRFRTMRDSAAALGGMAIDFENESVDFVNRQMGGMSDVLEKFREQLIGASGIPHNILFGESPSGLGATGESEEKTWSKLVNAYQNAYFTPKLRRLYRILWRANDSPSTGTEPEGWQIIWKPLLEQTEEEKASTRSTQSSTDRTYVDMGVLLPEEVRSSRFGGAEFAFETVLDDELWKKKQQEQELGSLTEGFGDFSSEELQGETPSSEESAPTLDSISIYRADAQYKDLPKDKQGNVYYQGRWWKPNQPYDSNRPGKKRMVLAQKGKDVKLVHYGASNYKHNYSEQAKKNYLARSAGIKNKAGELTKGDKFSPNYWSRKDLWDKQSKPNGKSKYKSLGQPKPGKKCGNSYIPQDKECRTDSGDRAKYFTVVNNIKLGITHVAAKDLRHGKLMKASYGYISGSYGKAEDGMSIDIYLNQPASPDSSIFSVIQINPDTQKLDEYKYMFGYANMAAAKKSFIEHASVERFGGIKRVENELDEFRVRGRTSNTENQDSLSPILNQAITKSKQPIKKWLDTIQSTVDGATSWEDLQTKLDSLYEKLDDKEFEQVVYQGRVLSDLLGRSEVEEEGR